MSLPPGYWPWLAADYVAAYVRVFGGTTPSRTAVMLAMSVAEHETNNGRAWPGTNNFGAVQLRPLTLQERAAYDAGTLHAGDYTADRTGVLHIDTHPGPNGPIAYPVWFAAFANRVDGIAHFIRELWRLSSGAPDAEDATPDSLAEAMYLHGYYEGGHHGARPPQQRHIPLTPPELANVSDYAVAVTRCLASIATSLTAWDYGRDRAAGETSDALHERDTQPELPPDPAA